MKSSKTNLGIAVFATIAALISAIAGGISAYMAFQSWDLSRALSEPMPGLKDTKVKIEIVDPNELKLRLSFVLVNAGKTPLFVHGISAGWAHKAKHKFEKKVINPVANPMYAGSDFTYSCNWRLTTEGTFPPENELGEKLPKIIGSNAIVLRVAYSTRHRKEEPVKYFLRYGKAGIQLLKQDEYQELEILLPDEFKVNK